MLNDSQKPFSLVETDGGQSNKNQKSIDQVIDDIGMGRYQIQLLIMAGIAISCEVMELTILTFLQGCVAVEWNLSTTVKSSLTISIFFGQIIGLFIFGQLADTYGRRKIILIGWNMIIIFGMLSSLSPNIYILIILRTLVGVGIGSQIIFFDLVLELLPIKNRGTLLVLSNLFFAFGEIFIVLLAYATLGSLGWRWLVFFSTLPVLIITVIGAWILPESPRWLLTKHRITEAEEVFSVIANINRKVLPYYILKDDFPGYSNSAPNVLDLFSPNLISITMKTWLLW